MANADTSSACFTTNFPFGGRDGKVMSKRKTPSQLREEQLKRQILEMPNSSEVGCLPSNDRKATHDLKCPKPVKNPKYINTRVNERFPVTKSGNKSYISFGQEKTSKGYSISKKVVNQESPFHDHKPYDDCASKGKNLSELPGEKIEKSDVADKSATDTIKISNEKVFQKVNMCSQNTFRSVSELSLGTEKLNGFPKIDMEKALKGLVSNESSIPSCSDSVPLEKSGNHTSYSRNSSSGIHILDNKYPLDFTLKRTVRLIFSSSVRWCNHQISGGSSGASVEFGSLFSCADQVTGCNQGLKRADLFLQKALCSWAYPQFSFPSSIFSALSLSTSRAEKEMLEKRYRLWRDAFCNLYYKLRKNKCDSFYVYTSQFVALFVNGSLLGKKQNTCNAYLSQSTHGLRCLLAEHDIHFTMPLCHTHPQQASPADLVEFLEIEKCNLGKAHHLDSSFDIDNKPQSLLAFLGNRSVQALYEFLQNYRDLLSSLANSDVPMLLAPVAFLHASISIPEVKCNEMRKADVAGTKAIPSLLSTSVCSSIELKDDILPPWIISRTCAAFQEMSFEARFTTDPKSLSLNFALNALIKSDECKGDNELNAESSNLHIPHTIISPELKSGYLTGLTYTDGNYTAFTNPI